MTAPHKATPEQWELFRKAATGNNFPMQSVALELADRLAAAEQRISELEGNSSAPVTSSPAPAGGLVEMVAEVISNGDDGHHWHDESRAAILAAADWLGRQGVGAGTTAARWLREEVQRHA